jgi:hypothetical protein
MVPVPSLSGRIATPANYAISETFLQPLAHAGYAAVISPKRHEQTAL